MPHIYTEIPKDPCSLEEMRSEISPPVKQQICHCVFTQWHVFAASQHHQPSQNFQFKSFPLLLFIRKVLDKHFFFTPREICEVIHYRLECFSSSLDSVLIPCQTSWHVNPYSQKSFPVLRFKFTDVFTDFFLNFLVKLFTEEMMCS